MFMQVIFEESSMEIKKLAVLGGLFGASYQAAAHPDHLPFILVVAVVLVTGALLWKRRR
jgi:hypothetical protein